MPCYSPLKGYWGETAETGKKKLVFNRRLAKRPVELATVPCGQCIGCRLEYSRQWAVRIMHEAQSHQSNCFLTLTYDDLNIPPGKTLRHSDVQKFLKRFRKRLFADFGIKIRYYMCGEYGDETGRPHYHLCIFGYYPHDAELYKTTKLGHKLYLSRYIENIWGKGFCPIGELTYESAAYVARYVLKKQRGKEADEHYRSLSLVDQSTGELLELSPEYSCCSRRPGIGNAWIQEHARETLATDSVVVSGREQGVPSYYQKYLEKEFKEKYDQNKAKRLEKLLANPEEYTPERLESKSRIREAKIQHCTSRAL